MPILKVRETPFSALISALGLLVLVAVSCRMTSLPGTKVNLFEGTAAQEGGAKIKEKLGVNDLRVKHIEIHEDRMQIVIQDPAKPKNFDEYTYAKGVITGPKPVQALVLGNKELTADNSRLFNLSEIDLGAVPETCRQAAERAKIEDGKPELVSIDWQHASIRLTKEERQQKRDRERQEFTRQARTGKLKDPMAQMQKDLSDLAVTWRIYVRGPRMTKDFWADEKGKLFEPSW